MPKKVQDNEILYHIGLSKEMIEGAEYVLVPGDPGRVESLAKIFDPKPKFLQTNREYTSYLANFHGQKVLVCSSGMGTPSTAIGIEELATIGLKYFLRIGTCGGIQSYTNLGDVIISSGAVRLDGTSKDYAPVEYPAIPSFSFTSDVIAAAEKIKVPYHVGITATTDTFWPGQERHDNYSGYLLRRFHGSMAEWRALNVLNFEMEAAAMFVICSAFGLHAACLCSVVAKRVESEAVSLQTKGTTAKDNWEKTAREAIHISMQRRGLIKMR